MNEARLDTTELSQICFTLFRSMHLNMFKTASAREKLDYFDSLVSGVLDPSKHFTMRDRHKRIGTQFSKSVIDWYVTSENIRTNHQSRNNRWLNGIYDEVNNCSNFRLINDSTSLTDSKSEKQENVESKSLSLGLNKSNLTMAHMFELCLKKGTYGTCRNCSSDVNLFTHDEFKLKFLDSAQEVIPECSSKLTSEDSFYGFNIIIKCKIASKTQTRFSLEKIQFTNESLRFCFLNALYKLDFSKRMNQQISNRIEILNQPINNCSLSVNFIIEDINPMTGAVKEAITQGYYPLIDGINYSNFNAVEKSPLLGKVEQLVEIISRSCNPMLFLSPEQFLHHDEKLLERISALEIDNDIDKWPPALLSITSELRKLLNEGLRYGVESESLRDLLFKELKSEAESNLIRFSIDTTRFWM